MQTKSIGSVTNFLKYISKQKPSDGYSRFYRGQASKEWKLEPSIFRKEFTEIKEKERKLINELLIHYPDTFVDCQNDFEKLVVAQHYGIPTRLLDLTTNPLVALFFACYRKSDIKGNARVYIIDIPTVNIHYFNEDNITEITRQYFSRTSIEPSSSSNMFKYICVKARLNNPRIIRQSGAFLLYDGIDTKDDSRRQLKDIGKIFSVEISTSHIKKITKDLEEMCGITLTTLFPELPQYGIGLKDKTIRL